jgi:hypothetical protein
MKKRPADGRPFPRRDSPRSRTSAVRRVRLRAANNTGARRRLPRPRHRPTRRGIALPALILHSAAHCVLKYTTHEPSAIDPESGRCTPPSKRRLLPCPCLRAPLSRAGQDHVQRGGWVRTPWALDGPALAAFDPMCVADFVGVCTLDGPHGGPRRLRGVPLRILIGAAQPAFDQRTDFKRMAVVAKSREGYRALFSWTEVQLGGGRHLVVARESDEAPLPARQGPTRWPACTTGRPVRASYRDSPRSNSTSWW